MPRISIKTAETGTATSNDRCGRMPIAADMAAVTTSDAVANPTPPIPGVAVECHRSALGGIIARRRMPRRRARPQKLRERMAAPTTDTAIGASIAHNYIKAAGCQGSDTWSVRACLRARSRRRCSVIPLHSSPQALMK